MFRGMPIMLSGMSNPNSQIANKATLFSKEEIKQHILETLIYYKNIIIPILTETVESLKKSCVEKKSIDDIIDICVEYFKKEEIKKLHFMTRKTSQMVADDTDGVFAYIQNHHFTLAAMNPLYFERLLNKENVNPVKLFLFELIHEYNEEITLMETEIAIKRIDKLNDASNQVEDTRHGFYM